MIRIQIVHVPPIASIDGLRLDCFEVGKDYEVGNSLGAMFLAERWAVPVPLDAEPPPALFTADDPYDANNLYPPKSSRTNLIRETVPPHLDKLPTAVAFHRRRRKRQTRR